MSLSRGKDTERGDVLGPGSKIPKDVVIDSMSCSKVHCASKLPVPILCKIDVARAIVCEHQRWKRHFPSGPAPQVYDGAVVTS